MSSRQIQYTIKLLSDIANTAKKDAQAVESSNARMAKSYDAMAKSADKQVKQLERTLAGLNKNAAKAGASLDKMGGGVGARMSRQLDISIAKLRKMKSAADGVGNSLQKIGKYTAVAAGAAVGGTVATKAMIEKPVAYEERVARMSITADKGNTVAGFESVKTQIEQGIKSANQAGGGTRDNAAGALDNMLASGQDLSSALKALPAILKASTASGADATELSNIIIKGKQNGYIKDGQESAFLDKSVAAGKAGQFELKDMAKWLGQQMSAGQMAGLTGEKGFDRLLMMNQAAMASAGSKDEAGNNVANLLAKLNSADTAKDFQKQTGKDLSKYLVNTAKNGGDSVDAWVSLLRDEMRNNKDYQAAQAKLNSAATPEDKRAANESITNLAMGSSVGGFFQDRQALAALIPLLTDNGGADSSSTQVKTAIANSNGVVNSDFNKYQTTTAAKIDAAGNAKDNAASAAFDTVKPAIDGMVEGFTSAAESFPKVTTAVTLLGAAAVASAAAMGGGAATGGMLDWFRKRKKRTNKRGAPDAPDAPDAADLPSIGGAPAMAGGGVMDVFVTNMGAGSMGGGLDLDADGTGSKTGGDKGKLGKLKGFARGAGKAGLIGAGIGLVDGLYDAATSDGTRGEKTQMVTKSVGGAAGGLAGAEVGAIAGAAIGSFVPVLGTAIGAVVGGLIGGGLGAWGGSAAGDKVGGYARDAIDGPNAAPALGGTADTAGIQAAVASGVGQGMAGLPAALAAPSAAPPPAYLSVPALAAAPPPQQQVAVTIQDGKLAISVTVSPTSELLSAVARAAQPVVPIMASLSGGSTNPAGYA